MSLGSDFSGVDDIDSALTYLEGEAAEQVAFAQAIARRYETPNGGLWYDGNYGLDLRTFLVDQLPPQVVEGMISAEARKDERCVKCTAEITVQADGAWQIKILPTSDEGETYELTMAVTTETAALLLSRLLAI